jgi:hypothetical protein
MVSGGRMSQYEFLHLGTDENGSVLYRQMANGIGVLINSRLMDGESTSIRQLRDALILLIGEVDGHLEKMVAQERGTQH